MKIFYSINCLIMITLGRILDCLTTCNSIRYKFLTNYGRVYFVVSKPSFKQKKIYEHEYYILVFIRCTKLFKSSCFTILFLSDFGFGSSFLLKTNFSCIWTFICNMEYVRSSFNLSLLSKTLFYFIVGN